MKITITPMQLILAIVILIAGSTLAGTFTKMGQSNSPGKVTWREGVPMRWDDLQFGVRDDGVVMARKKAK